VFRRLATPPSSGRNAAVAAALSQRILTFDPTRSAPTAGVRLTWPRHSRTILRILPRRPDSIDRDCNHDYGADDYFLNIVRPAHWLAAVAQNGHYESPDDRAQHPPLPSAQAAAADYNRCNDVQLSTNCHGWIALPQPGHLHHSG